MRALLQVGMGRPVVGPLAQDVAQEVAQANQRMVATVGPEHGPEAERLASMAPHAECFVGLLETELLAGRQCPKRSW